MKMKLNKACGADGIYAEHLRYASSEIVVIIKWLINECLLHAYVLRGFGTSIICPVPKKSNATSQFDQYRPICLISIISKVLESCLCTHFENFVIDELQYGFTRNGERNKALFMLKLCILLSVKVMLT